MLVASNSASGLYEFVEQPHHWSLKGQNWTNELIDVGLCTRAVDTAERTYDGHAAIRGWM